MLTLYCDKDQCFKGHVVCLYVCSKLDKKRCRVYRDRLEEIKTTSIESKYIERYGAPVIWTPPEPKKRKVKPVKVSKKKDVVPTKRIIRSIPAENNTIDLIDNTKKRKRRTKAEMLAVKSVAESEQVVVTTITDVPKRRTRRTKKEMEASRSSLKGEQKCQPKLVVTTKKTGKQSQSLELPVCTVPIVEKESTRTRKIRSDVGKLRAKKKSVDKV